MPSSVSLESKLDPSITQEPLNNNDFDSGFNDQDSASSQQSADYYVYIWIWQISIAAILDSNCETTHKMSDFYHFSHIKKPMRSKW